MSGSTPQSLDDPVDRNRFFASKWRSTITGFPSSSDPITQTPPQSTLSCISRSIRTRVPMGSTVIISSLLDGVYSGCVGSKNLGARRLGSCIPLHPVFASATLTFVFQTVPAKDEKLYLGDDVTSESLQPFTNMAIIAKIIIPKRTFFIRPSPACQGSHSTLWSQ